MGTQTLVMAILSQIGFEISISSLPCHLNVRYALNKGTSHQIVTIGLVMEIHRILVI